MRPYPKHSILQNPASPCPRELFGRLVAVPVRFATFRGRIGRGVVEIHRDLVVDMEALFRFMLSRRILDPRP
jgi:hypothetical protein